MDKIVGIIGGGSAGLRLARRLAEQKIPVTVFEEHPEIGIPEHCSGLISARNTKELGFDLKASFMNDIYGAKIFSPNNTQLRIERKKPVAHVMDRSKFDKTLYKEAIAAGAQVELSTSVMSVKGNTLFTQTKGKGGMRKADVIVAADGVNSRLRKMVGIESPATDFMHTYQVKAAGTFDPNFVELYLGNEFAPHFFAWVIPESDESAKVGIGCKVGVNPSHAFNAFLKEKQIDIHVKESNSFLVPCAPPIRKIVFPPIVLLGDAAYQTKATSGGGIIMNCKSADILGKVIGSHFTNGTPLTEYESRMNPIFKELELHWKIHQFQKKMTDTQLNSFFLKLKDAGIEEFLSKEGEMDEPSHFIGKLFTHPGMISLLPEALHFMLMK
ncbi:MAG: NAD(P)/FAD-dependent oxidoreductase [Candidatus Diapherotrites archaeon]